MQDVLQFNPIQRAALVEIHVLVGRDIARLQHERRAVIHAMQARIRVLYGGGFEG